MVFLEQRDRGYLARRILPGRVGDDTVEILGGLQEGDRVVTEGGLILDGQAQLARAAITGDAWATNHDAAPQLVAAGGDEAEYVQLKPLAFAAADAATALAADDFKDYKRQLPALRTALQAYFDGYADAAHGPLVRFKDTPPRSN